MNGHFAVFSVNCQEHDTVTLLLHHQWLVRSQLGIQQSLEKSLDDVGILGTRGMKEGGMWCPTG